MSSTTAESVTVDDLLPVVLWTPLFIKHQGCEVNNKVVHQDKKSATLLEKNGRSDTGKRS